MVDRVAAVVNGEVITLSEVYELGGEYIDQRMGRDGDSSEVRRTGELDVLDSLILRVLMSQEVVRLEMQIVEEDVDRAIDDIARRNQLDRDRLQAEVERSGMTWTQYRSELKESLSQMRFNQVVIQPRITVNEDELLDAYRRQTASIDLPMIVDLGAIYFAGPPLPPIEDGSDLTEDQRLAYQRSVDEIQASRSALSPRLDAVAQRLANGEDFATIAADTDEGPYGTQGGKMGTYRAGELTAVLDEPAFSVDVEALSEPIYVENGVFLLYVFDRRTQEPPAFESVRDDLFEQVYADRIDAETDVWFEQAQRASAILIKLETIQ